MRIVIYETDDGEYVISSRGVWLPGVYADLKAARWAYQFPNITLEQLSKTWTPITTEHLRRAQSRA